MSDPSDAPDRRPREGGVRGPDPLSELELDFTPHPADPPTLETPHFVPREPLGSGFEADMAEEKAAAARLAASGSGGGSETLMRFLVAIPLAALAITMIVVGGAVFAIGMLAFSCGALIEFFSMAARARPFASVALAVAGGLILAAYYGDQYQMMIVALASVPLMFVAGALRGSPSGITGAFAVTALGVLWIALPFAHAVLLRELPDHGAALLIDVLVATVISDTAAYGGGRMFGRHPLAPALSPKKTIEGLVFGFAGGTVAFWFAGLYQDWLPGTDALLMGLAVAAIAPLGDLFQSMIKRDLQVKDASSIFGPHGGILDRLDAVLFTVVVGYYLSVTLVY